MYGITGFVNKNGVKESDIKKMNNAVQHRGPDDSGVYVDMSRTVGFGHRRLSIIGIYRPFALCLLQLHLT